RGTRLWRSRSAGSTGANGRAPGARRSGKCCVPGSCSPVARGSTCRAPAPKRRPGGGRSERRSGRVRATRSSTMARGRSCRAGRIELPRFTTDFRDRSTLVVVRGVGHQRDLRALRPFIRDMHPVIVAVDGGAEALLEKGLTPDMIVGDMDSAGEAALRCGAEL